MFDQGDGFPARLAGGLHLDKTVAAFGEAGRLDDDGYTAIGAVGAAGQIGDGETGCGRGKDGARRRHAVEQAEYLELRLEFVGDAINGEVGLANRILNAGHESNFRTLGGERLGAELPAKKFLGMMQIVGHHVFKEDTEAATGCMKGQPATQWAGSDNCDSLKQIWTTWLRGRWQRLQR